MFRDEFRNRTIGMLNYAVEALFRDQLSGGPSECTQNTARQPSHHKPLHWFRPPPRRLGYARAIISLDRRIQMVSQQRCRTREQGEGNSDPISGVKLGGGRGAKAPADRRPGPRACAVDALLAGPFGQYETTGGRQAKHHLSGHCQGPQLAGQAGAVMQEMRGRFSLALRWKLK